jgi:hypothetical protein
LVKAVWTLEARGESSARITQDAVPDGCVEIIRRVAGRSYWHRPQPEYFVAGIIDEPATLEMSGDARFVGIRLWPWAWNLLDGPPARAFVDDWRPLTPSSLAGTLVSDPDESVSAVTQSLAQAEPPALARQILRSRNVAELSIRSGLSYRQLQRWFLNEIGIAPRRYLKLLRFQPAFADVASSASASERGGFPEAPAAIAQGGSSEPFIQTPQH